MEEERRPVYSHNPYQENGFPLLVLDVVRQACNPKNEGFRALHWHEEVQFIYVLEGVIRTRVYNEETEITARNGIFINQNAVHLTREKESCHYHSFIIPPRMLSFFDGSVMQEKDVTPILCDPFLTYAPFSRRDEDERKILEKLEELDEIYFAEQELPGAEYRISLAICSLWYELIRYLAHTEKKTGSKGSVPKDHGRIQKLLQYIHANYQENIQISDIAAAAEISPTECQRCFRKYVGESPHQYLMKYRLHTSRALLETTDRTVTDISESTGFSSVSACISAFRREYGVTPAQYRKGFSKLVN